LAAAAALAAAVALVAMQVKQEPLGLPI
jgi:hypothetical protein